MGEDTATQTPNSGIIPRIHDGLLKINKKDGQLSRKMVKRIKLSSYS